MKRAITLMLISTVGLMSYATAASTEATSAYKATKNLASSDYKIARSQCDNLGGNSKDICIAEAKATRVHTEENAKIHYKDTVSVRASAAKAMADADYDVARAKCDNQIGNDKDVCIKQASAIKVTSVSNAETSEKINEIRADSRKDKQKAEYKVALEKCDALLDVSKDICVANAKTQFSQ
jgi:hypothetical protein